MRHLIQLSSVNMTGTSASYVKFEFFLFILRALQCERFHWTVRFKFSNEITKTEYSKKKTINIWSFSP